jgi:hypothetical protein
MFIIPGHSRVESHASPEHCEASDGTLRRSVFESLSCPFGEYRRFVGLGHLTRIWPLTFESEKLVAAVQASIAIPAILRELWLITSSRWLWVLGAPLLDRAVASRTSSRRRNIFDFKSRVVVRRADRLLRLEKFPLNLSLNLSA